jgi:hypothetical protein
MTTGRLRVVLRRISKYGMASYGQKYMTNNTILTFSFYDVYNTVWTNMALETSLAFGDGAIIVCEIVAQLRMSLRTGLPEIA